MAEIKLLLKQTKANPRKIELEITEGVLLNDDMATHQTLHALRDIGFKIALDDFGTGYSSLSYLRKYPVDKVKIDRSFITNLGKDRESEAVVGAIVKLARALSLEVIAEGVETEAQLAGLHRAGCSHVQGYVFAKPMPADDITQQARVFPSEVESPNGLGNTANKGNLESLGFNMNQKDSKGLARAA